MFNTQIPKSLVRESSIKLLEANDLVLRQDPRQLMKALSYALYSTEMFANQIKQSCLTCFKQQNVSDIGSVAEYLSNPLGNQFDYLNLELISQCHKVKIELYYIDDGLVSTIMNRNYDRTIRLFQDQQYYYEVQTEPYSRKFKSIRKTVVDIINNMFESPIKRGNDFSQHVHPTLDVICNLNELSVRSCAPKDKQKKFTYDQPHSLTPQYKINSTTPYQQRSPEQMSSQRQYPLPYGPITPLIKQQRAFNYSQQDINMDIKSAHKASDQIREEADETQFLNDIMKQAQPPAVPFVEPQGARVIGRLKFFHEGKQYGFFVDEQTNKDIFVHLDDMQKSHIDPDVYRKLRKGYMMYFSFQVILYQGKAKQNVKAIDIKMERCDPPLKQNQ